MVNIPNPIYGQAAELEARTVCEKVCHDVNQAGWLAAWQEGPSGLIRIVFKKPNGDLVTGPWQNGRRAAFVVACQMIYAQRSRTP